MAGEIHSDFYVFDWLVQPERSRLIGPDGEVHLAPRTMDVLLCLAERVGEVVSRETFGERVWAPTIVTDDTLTRCIFELRRALGDSRASPRYIETVPKRGYRLMVPVTPVEACTDGTSLAQRRQTSPNNLPLQRSSFIGRGAEIARVQSLLATHALVTLIGVGGAGKTRLALEVSRQQLGRFRHGVFFIDLSSLSEGALIARTAAAAMDLPLAGLQPNAALTAVIDFLKKRSTLLLVDNCEHLIAESAAFVDGILANCPAVKVLATSREPLNIEGEQVFRVPSLGLPAPNADARDSDAVALFAERAAEADADFRLDASNEATVAEIARRLDGIPLALELAAARVTHMSLAEIQSRLEDRFRLLTDGRRQRARRQQTLQAAVDWSHELLNEEQRVLLRRLSVFAGGFTPQAVEGICMEETVEPGQTLELLAALVARSLVIREPREGSTRFRLLETIRLYAAERLREAGEAESFHRRHRDWFLDRVESHPLDELVFRYDLADELAVEIDNFRSALDWSRARGDFTNTARLAVALTGLWSLAGHHEEGYRRLRELRQQADIDPALRAQCLAISACAAVTQGDLAAMEAQSRLALELDPAGPLSGLALGFLGIYCITSEQPDEARRYLEDAFRRAEQHGLAHHARWARALAAMIDVVECRYRKVIAEAERSLEENAGPSHDDLLMRMALAGALLLNERPEEARKHGRLMHTRFANWLYAVWGRLFAGQGAAELGEYNEARHDLVAAGRTLLERSHPMSGGDCVIGFAALNAAEGCFERACTLLQSVVSTYRKLGFPFRSAVSLALYMQQRERAQQALDSKAIERAEAAGEAMAMEEALRDELERAESSLAAQASSPN